VELWYDVDAPGGVTDFFPDGGLTDEVLTKRSDADQDVEWQAVANPLPLNGTARMALVKATDSDFDVVWDGPHWKSWSGTQAEFDAIATKDPFTLYAIV
jgi:hypothetical protein